MNKLPIFALILIAGWAINTWATGTNVYKCGATYSQTPCERAIPVRVDDDRSPDQKKQSDVSTQQQARTANALEKTRVKEENLAQSEATKLHQASAKISTKAETNKKKKAAQEAQDAQKPVLLSPPTGKGKRKKEPEYFTAKAAQAPRAAASAGRK